MNYDERAFYEREIKPRMQEIIVGCKERKIPYAMMFQYALAQSPNGLFDIGSEYSVGGSGTPCSYTLAFMVKLLEMAPIQGNDLARAYLGEGLPERVADARGYLRALTEMQEIFAFLASAHAEATPEEFAQMIRDVAELWRPTPLVDLLTSEFEKRDIEAEFAKLQEEKLVGVQPATIIWEGSTVRPVIFTDDMQLIIAPEDDEPKEK